MVAPCVIKFQQLHYERDQLPEGSICEPSLGEQVLSNLINFAVHSTFEEVSISNSLKTKASIKFQWSHPHWVSECLSVVTAVGEGSEGPKAEFTGIHCLRLHPVSTSK